jgi:hypothetical protein
MAGTLTISTLSDGTNSTSATNCIQGSAKAWVNFNGSTAVINASYNVSSITRNATGEYTVNFTNAMSDANYGFAISVCNIAGTATVYSQAQATPPTTTTIRFATTNTSGTTGDVDRASVTIFR